MVTHTRLVPDREGLPLRVSMEALRVARLRQTNIPGNIATDGTIDASSMNLTDDLNVKGMAIKASIDQMRPRIDQAAQDAADAAARADTAGAKADEMAGRIDDVERTVTDQGVRIDGAVTEANKAVAASSETRQSLTKLSATVENHYTEQQGVNQTTLDRVAKVETTADGISQTVASNYKELKDGQETTNDRVTTVETTANGLKTQVSSTYTTAQSALAQATAAQQDIDGFKSTVSDTYATKDTVTELSTQWEQDKDGFTASIKQAQTTADKANAGAMSDGRYLNTIIRLDSDGVLVGRDVNGTPSGNYTRMGSDGKFHVSTPAGKDVLTAGQNQLSVNGLNGERRLEVYGDDSNHFYIALHPASGSSEPVQEWQTGWNSLPLAPGMTGNIQYTLRGGVIRFRGRVTPPSGTADATVNATDLPTFTSGTNRNFICWGISGSGILTACNVWIPADKLTIRLGGSGWQWVSLDNLSIPT